MGCWDAEVWDMEYGMIMGRVGMDVSVISMKRN